MKITVEVRTVYGNQSIYPVCETAKTFCELLGTKTLPRRQIDLIKKLGYQIEVTQNVPVL